MAAVPIKPGKTKAELTARGRANRIPPELLQAARRAVPAA